MALWGGRFEEEPDALFCAFNDSLAFDHRLLPDDLTGSIAWAQALHEAGVLSDEELDQLTGELHALRDVYAGNTVSVVEDGDEDVHSWVERKLVERLGNVGKKLHTGRSRNDQVATDLRLWIARALDARHQELRSVQSALLACAERWPDAVMPGYTHLQRAQPVLFAHWCLSLFEMFQRDIARIAAAKGSALSHCPLGCGALAGTAYAIDRGALATALGFAAPARNSLDAVSDRDFVLDALHAVNGCALHLSKVAEDLILYCSGEYGFVTLSDRVTSGSSLMPQKKNPDALELLRGKCGRILGAYQTLTVVLKGLPSAYNKDLQEDKQPLFDAMDQLSMSLKMLSVVFDGLELNVDLMRGAAQSGYSNATELADYLVSKGVAFRDAHEITGRIVRRALVLRLPLEALPLEEMQSVHEGIREDVRASLSLESLLDKRQTLGGTSPIRVKAELARARTLLDEDRCLAGKCL